MNAKEAKPIVLTMGDPAGIGLDITISAWRDRHAYPLPPFLLLADPECVGRRARLLGQDIRLTEADAENAVALFSESLPIAPLAADAPGDAGRVEPANAKAVIEAMEKAVELVIGGAARAMVTNPISKAVLYAEGFAFPGHTEFLADRAEKHTGRPVKPVMMLAGPKLRAVPVTIHIPLSDVPRQLSREAIVETAAITAGDLRTRFGIARPRLAISGLNPHAGEDGAMGHEDAVIIAPAVAELKDRGIDAVGPLPADTMFHDAARQSYDAAICMYHDQALIPAKALGFDDTVNVTLGLPFVRTSPDHGTAFNIAGNGTARHDSLVAALRLADRMSS